MILFKKILTCIVIQEVLFQTANQFSFRPKYFKIEHAAPCPKAVNSGGLLENFDLSQPAKNKFQLGADIKFLRDITSPIHFHMKYSKCTLENLGSTCDLHEMLKVSDVCDRLLDKNAIWTPLMKIITPKLNCPIKKGIYLIRNGTFDLTMISRLPIDGFRYKTTLWLTELVHNATVPLLCFDADVSITLLSNVRSRHKGK